MLRDQPESEEVLAYEVALEQFEAMDAPTFIVPVTDSLGRSGVFYASYDGDGDAEWKKLARLEEFQAELAVMLCCRAHADAVSHLEAHFRDI